MSILWRLTSLFLILPTLLFNSNQVFASSCPSDDPCRDRGSVFDKVACYTNVVNSCATERESMAAQVVYLSTKIELTTSKIEASKIKIDELKKEIAEISEKIEKLENSLTKITGIFIDRIIATYKYKEVSYLDLLLTSRRFSDLVNRFKYIQTVQAHDRKILFQLQNSKVNFEDQKQLREEKSIELDQLKKQLEKEQSTLAVQKKEKELFLETTKNSESRYKQELAAAQREAEGIQKAASILSAAGIPERVSRGAVIGVMGNSGFSTGPHLHFSVYNLNESDLNKFNFNSGFENPFNVLVSRNVTFEAASCDDVSPNQKQSKSVGSGSFEWPMANSVVSQCFGHTPWSWRYQTGIHNGIDMYDDDNPLIKSVEAGNAYKYRGGQGVGNGVFIFHNNGKMTLYWHLQ